ncbi:MAG: gluconate 2-dehydrogenase subunit 3 family protein [Candidatus Sulfotelmatobacter sp.]
MRSVVRKHSTAASIPTVSKRAPKPHEQLGYYPGHSTLGQQEYWDETTRLTVLKRVYDVPPIRFFQPEAALFWEAVFDHLLPQSDRTPDRKIPILNHVDHRLDINQTQGYRFENMPPDRDAYKLGMRAINEESRARLQRDFTACSYEQREETLKVIHDGEPIAAQDIWGKMSVHRFWQLILGDAIDAYYAHPWAWDEIGFGGPAHPRAYMRLERGEPEPWEVEEQRCEWKAPEGARSDETEDVREHFIESVQHMSHQKRLRNK